MIPIRAANKTNTTTAKMTTSGEKITSFTYDPSHLSSDLLSEEPYQGPVKPWLVISQGFVNSFFPSALARSSFEFLGIESRGNDSHPGASSLTVSIRAVRSRTRTKRYTKPVSVVVE